MYEYIHQSVCINVCLEMYESIMCTHLIFIFIEMSVKILVFTKYIDGQSF